MNTILIFIEDEVLMANYLIRTNKMFNFQAESPYRLLVNEGYEEFRHFSYK